MRKTLLTALAAATLGLSPLSRADTLIVDTGPPTNSWPAHFVGGTGLDGMISQWLAGQFTLDQAYDIQAMQGYLSVNVAGEVLVTIYSDHLGSPDAALFSKTFMSADQSFYGWQGTTGASGHLDAGTYWIAFGTPDGSAFQGGMGTGALTAPVMASEAYRVNMGGGQGWSDWWVAPQDSGLGVYARIYANAVPEPGSYALWLAGLCLVGTVVRRRTARAP